MKANELRIGNYILLKGFTKPTQVWIIDTTETSTKTTASPILLTEEWLLKFDFISNPYEDRYEKGPIHVECDKTKGKTYLWIENMPHIKYVHQLQNLYFALTGLELTKEVSNDKQ
jgi:hypothetical protein